MTSPQPDDIKLTGEHRTPAEKEAIGYMLVNLSAPAGFGTWLAGRKLLGGLQMACSFVGLGATMYGFFQMVSHILQRGLQDHFATPGLVTALLGILIYLLVLGWSLFSGWRYLRQVQRSQRNLTQT
ncbi:MAG: hypothetical protein AAGK14_12095 [Verrucomicrobiota bacterium]